jgi:hypothetical protein
MQKILFITWDGPQTSYMEGLFMPILSQVQKQSDYVFHVIQFTWASTEKINITQKAAQELNINFTAKSIARKPVAIIGNLFTIYKGISYLKKYINKHDIKIVMPRSTMPAIMVNRIPKHNFKVVFDADGLPLEERVDFSGLLKSSKQYQFLKNEESKMILRAEVVLTRSQKAIEIHLKTINNNSLEKFSVVLNGRDSKFFTPRNSVREKMRTDLNVSNQTKVFVFCGSLGPQYGWDEMISIFDKFQIKHPESLFLILTGNIEFAEKRIPKEISNKIKVIKVPFEEVPKYLSAADIAFAIREPRFSMQAIAPIKLGEYLLMGIPTIASKDIGDTEQILDSIPNCYLYNHQNSNRVQESIQFIESIENSNFEEIRKYALPYFSLEKSAESYCKALDKIR